MEIYNKLATPASQEFEKLLNSQLSKSKDLIEGKIIEGKITKISEKFCFLFIEGLKSEPVLDINELKSMGMLDKVKLGEKISVLLERIEDKNGEVVVSASKAKKIEGWNSLIKKYDNNELISCKLVSRVKGGAIAEHVETGTLMFMPGSQISDRIEKDISRLFGEVMEVAIIKADRERGNLCVSRRQVISSGRKEDKSKIIEKYKINDIIKSAVFKSASSFGCFFEVNGELDVLVHQAELSWSRVSDPSELFTAGDKQDLMVITTDAEKLQVGCSIKRLTADPFTEINNYELNVPMKAKVVKLMDYGAFVEIDKKIQCLFHVSECSWTKKNPTIKKMFSINDEIDVMITSVDQEKRHVAVSHKLCLKNPFDLIIEKFPVGTKTEAIVETANEYALYVKLSDEIDVLGFLHQNEISYEPVNDETLSSYKKGSKIEVQIMEIDKESGKIRVSARALLKDEFKEFFEDKKENDVLTVKVVSSEKKGLIVQPEGSNLKFPIKRSQIAINPHDARSERFVGSEKIDCAIESINFETRKVNLSIKLLESLQNKEAVSKFGSELSGKNLPFSKLSEKLKNKETEEE